MKFGICAGRHDIPEIDKYIFEQEVNPLDISGLYNHALEVLHPHHGQRVTVYVTGLTVATVAIINAARTLFIALTLMHYNRDNGEYYAQEVLM